MVKNIRKGDIFVPYKGQGKDGTFYVVKREGYGVMPNSHKVIRFARGDSRCFETGISRRRHYSVLREIGPDLNRDCDVSEFHYEGHVAVKRLTDEEANALMKEEPRFNESLRILLGQEAEVDIRF